MPEKRREWTANSMIGESVPDPFPNPRGTRLLFLAFECHTTAGAGGGLVASIATCPLDVIKTKLQAQRYSQGQKGYEGVIGQRSLVHCPFRFRALLPPTLFQLPNLFTCSHDTRAETDWLSIDTIKSVWRNSGFKGFYRGLGPTMLGYLPTWAIYFAVYDGIKTTFGEVPLGVQAPPMPPAPKFGGPVAKEDGRGKDRVLYPAAQPKGYQPVVREHPWGLHIMSAMIAGAASTTCTNPLWVIKTRFMVRSTSNTQSDIPRPFSFSI